MNETALVAFQRHNISLFVYEKIIEIVRKGDDLKYTSSIQNVKIGINYHPPPPPSIVKKFQVKAEE